jgi:hypothetical protein
MSFLTPTGTLPRQMVCPNSSSLPNPAERDASRDPECFDFPAVSWIPLRCFDLAQHRPFDIAQGGEPVEPRVSPAIVGLARSKIPTSSAGNDSFVEL